MNILKILVFGLAISTSAFAASTDILCVSANYEVKISHIGEDISVNYAINKEWNEGADVALGQSYMSDRIITISLAVDGQDNKIEINASKNKAGIFTGKLYFGEKIQNVSCTLTNNINNSVVSENNLKIIDGPSNNKHKTIHPAVSTKVK